VYYDINLKEVVEKVRKILEKEDKVLIAVIFGSATRRNRVRDIDVAVYLKPKYTLKELLLLEAKIEKILKVPVDLVPLDQASLKLAYKALAKGIKVVVKDPLLYSSLLTYALGQIQDMRIKLNSIKVLE